MELRDYSKSLTCFRWKFEIKRRGIGYTDDEGRYIQPETITHINFNGAAPQPLNDRDLMMLDDGMEARSLVKTYADTESILFGDHVSVIYPLTEKRDYRVVAVSHRISHTRIYLEQLHRVRHD